MATSPRHAQRALAIIPAFQPSEDLLEHCAQLAPQVSTIVVIDDGSGESAHSVLIQLEATGVRVERMQRNSGIGTAINRGFAVAREMSVELVITFDQDSSVLEGFVDALVDEYDRLISKGLRVGMVAPDYYSQTPQSQISTDGEYLDAVAPIQSGLLMPLSAIDQLGDQRDDFFIDLIDTEYFFRARQAGFVAACVPGLVLTHGFGHRLYVYAFGKRLTKSDGRPRIVAVSSPFRYYYRARNRVLLNREFKQEKSIRKVLGQQTRNDLLLDFGVAVYSSKGKTSLLRLMWSGWRDGLRGRTGKMSPHLAQLASRVTWRHPADES